MAAAPLPYYVLRKATKHADRSPETKLLSDWRDRPLYVLLGDPGAGKSCCFKEEAEACGGLLISARDIVDGVGTKPKDQQAVFIDGLDEVRAGVGDPKEPLGQIRKWWSDAKKPTLRLSCRGVDWLGISDVQALPGMEVLHLEPLDLADIRKILDNCSTDVPDPRKFLEEANNFGLTELFGNPLLLDMTIRATQGANTWPSTRQGVFEQACLQLVQEKNDAHTSAAKPHAQVGDKDKLLYDAGLVCAVLLLSQTSACTSEPKDSEKTVALLSLPDAFSKLLNHAKFKPLLASKLFTSTVGSYAPRHRSIAEFLAAKALAQRLKDGLPLGRLLSLMQGRDGKIISPLRGLLAWLVVHCTADRKRLMAMDPLAAVLNGDATALTTLQRIELLHLLSRSAQENPWFAHQHHVDISTRFGALASKDMESTYQGLLNNHKRDPAHMAFMACMFDALRHGQAMPGLKDQLMRWAEDCTTDLQIQAYEAWKYNTAERPSPTRASGAKKEESQAAKQREWLDRTISGSPTDTFGSLTLTGKLLTDLYPRHIGPKEIWAYLKPTHLNNPNPNTKTWDFWHSALIRQSRKEDFSILADTLVSHPDKPDDSLDHQLWKLHGDVLSAALTHADKKIKPKRLYAWLALGLDGYGYSRLLRSHPSIAQWLEDHPTQFKQVLAWAYHHPLRNEHGEAQFLKAEWRMHGARKPRDWLRWHLKWAALDQDEILAEYCFKLVARSSVDPDVFFDTPGIEEIEQWVQNHQKKWPQAQAWWDEVRQSALEDWPGEVVRAQKRQQTKTQQEIEHRQRAFAPHLQALAQGLGPAQLQLGVAQAIHAETTVGSPLERVQTLLQTDQETAQEMLAGSAKVLERSDLPSAQDIFKSAAKNSYFYLQSPVLWAAQQRFEESHSPPAPSPQVGKKSDVELRLPWTNALAQTVLAFYFVSTDGSSYPEWYLHLMQHRPQWVADVAIEASKKARATICLQNLGQDIYQKFISLVLPVLLENFPKRANPKLRDWLNCHLLANLHRLEPALVRKITKRKLALEMDPLQRIVWLVAELPYRAEAAADLAQWVGKSEPRAIALGEALRDQNNLNSTAHPLPPDALGQLIAVLAPMTPAVRSSFHHGSITTVHRGWIVNNLLGRLSNDPSQAACRALIALTEQANRFRSWETDVGYAIQMQRIATREKDYQALLPNAPNAVALVIANGPPACPADLQALVVQHLRDIEAQLRGEASFALKQFWQNEKPQNENYCRDLLQEKLKPRLNAMDVTIGSEVREAQNKRSDMRVEFICNSKTIALPIEVKKATDQKLWTAWNDQLKIFYTNDPATLGYGLYLVLWFGTCQATPEGGKPQSADELSKWLIKKIPKDEQHLICVLVMDLSLPS
jgi:hypothetical protein